MKRDSLSPLTGYLEQWDRRIAQLDQQLDSVNPLFRGDYFRELQELKECRDAIARGIRKGNGTVRLSPRILDGIGQRVNRLASQLQAG